MKKCKSVLALILSLVLMFATTIPAYAGSILENLVQNPGFENGLDCWETKTSGPNDNVEATFCKLNYNLYGLKALKATAVGSISVSQEILLPVSGTYKLSLFGKYENGIKPSNGGEISVEIESKGESYTYVHPGDEKSDFDFSLTFTVSKSTKVKIILNAKYTTGIFDNVSLLRIGSSPDGSTGEIYLKIAALKKD